jgi:hypothetical protein
MGKTRAASQTLGVTLDAGALIALEGLPQLLRSCCVPRVGTHFAEALDSWVNLRGFYDPSITRLGIHCGAITARGFFAAASGSVLWVLCRGGRQSALCERNHGGFDARGHADRAVDAKQL